MILIPVHRLAQACAALAPHFLEQSCLCAALSIKWASHSLPEQHISIPSACCYCRSLPFANLNLHLATGRDFRAIAKDRQIGSCGNDAYAAPLEDIMCIILLCLTISDAGGHTVYARNSQAGLTDSIVALLHLPMSLRTL